MTETPNQPDLQLPGYLFESRLGAGGFGEVWRAVVPGGLTKAVKLVFGRYDGTHAESEMRALERVKQVRHPFLLSLERIEVVENRLIVVTELADGSLRDRFNDCRRDGQPGIERGELLKYLRDAADALDYICTNYELQHLDIKPENLLLVGGHVKVADFGLVKDLHTTQASMVGGMTPTYAAPELFRGSPTRFSDQYSLAILYQQLLTGTLPFKGTTAAELTLQHVNELPNLDALGEGDRFVLSQALAKDPDHRFASCSAMVEALLNQTSGTELSETATAPVEANAGVQWSQATESGDSSEANVTQLFDDDQANWAGGAAPVMIDLPEVAPLEPAEGPRFDAEEFVPAPAVVIGVGGTAGPILRELRQQITTSVGADVLGAAIKMLLLDTDTKGIAAATRESKNGLPIPPSDMLCLPLRHPKEYRETSAKLLNWISRRWLYNIPKSLRTEGIRPLGRLALVDNARQVLERLRDAVCQATDANRLAGLKEATGTEFDASRLRIYLVGSLSGGTSSGMLHDLAYATRAVLGHLGVKAEKIIAVTTHATSRQRESSEISRVNSFAWLTEHGHWSNRETPYPGDESAGLPSASAEVAPFDDLYVVNIGDRVDDHEFFEATRSIAAYLHLDMLTGTQQWLDACRAIDASDTTTGQCVRSFSLDVSKPASDLDPSEIDSHIAQIVAAATASPDEDDNEQLEAALQKLQSDWMAKPDQLTALARSEMRSELGGKEFVQVLRELVVAAGYTPETLTMQGAVELIDRELGPYATETCELKFQDVPVTTIAERCSDALQLKLQTWALGHVARQRWGIQALGSVAEQLSKLLESSRSFVDQWSEQTEGETQHLLASAAAGPPQDAGKQAVAYWRLRLERIATEVARLAIAGLCARLEDLTQRWMHLGTLASQLPDELTMPGDGQASSAKGRELYPLFAAAFTSQPAVAELLDRDAPVAEVLPLLRSAMIEALETQSATSPASTRREPSTMPRLLHQGGHYYHAEVMPESSASESSDATLGVAKLRVANARPACLVEAGGLSLLHTAAQFVAGRRDYVELAERVHVRSDIAWPSLLQRDEPPWPQNVAESPAEAGVFATQMVEISEFPSHPSSLSS